LLEGVDAGPVPVAPVYSKSVGSYQLERKRTDVGWHQRRVKQGAATHFLDTRGAGAGQPERPSRKEPLMPGLIPFDEDTVVATVDGVGEGVVHGYWQLAIGYWLLDDLTKNKKPPKSEGF
jgi:hypothetical protein